MASKPHPKKMKKKILSSIFCIGNISSDSNISTSTVHMNTSTISNQGGDRIANDYELQDLAASEPINEESVDLAEGATTNSTIPRNRDKTFTGDPDDNLLENENAESFKLFDDSCMQRVYSSEEDLLDENENVEVSSEISERTYEEAFIKNYSNLPCAPPMPKTISDGGDSTPFNPTEDDITNALRNRGIFAPRPPKSLEIVDGSSAVQDIHIQNKAQETHLNLNLLDRNSEDRNSGENLNQSNTLEQQEPEKIPSPSSEGGSQTETEDSTIKNPSSTRNQILSKVDNRDGDRDERNSRDSSAKESEPNLDKSISRIANSTDEGSLEVQNENEELPIQKPAPAPTTVQVQGPVNDSQVDRNESGPSSQVKRNEAGTSSNNGNDESSSPVPVKLNQAKTKKPKIMLPKKINKSRLVINSSPSESESGSPSTSKTSSPNVEKSSVEPKVVETTVEKKRKSSAKYFLAIKKSLKPSWPAQKKKKRKVVKNRVLIQKPQLEVLLQVYHQIDVKKEHNFVSNFHKVLLEYLETFLKTLQDNCADPTGIYTFKELERAALAEKLITVPGQLQGMMTSIFNLEQMQKMISHGLYPISESQLQSNQDSL